MKLDLILRVTTKLLLPFILLFALYVHFHGDYGPGGGFQAGVIAAGMVILYAIVFGVEPAQRVVPQWLVAAMVPLGVLGTALAFVFMATLVGRAGATRGSIAIYFVPVVAMVLGVVFRSEQLAPIAIVGLALVLLGAWFASRRES